jgi:hypothetical protein
MTFMRDWSIAALMITLLIYATFPDRAGIVAAQAVKAYNTEMARP